MTGPTEGADPAPSPPPSASPPTRRIKDASEAAKELHQHFGDWSGSLGKYGLQFALALMAANWALHGTSILEHPWARASMAMAIGYLAFTLLSLGHMVLLSYQRHRYADANKERWAREFDESAGAGTAWPYTPQIEAAGLRMLWAHVIGPVIIGVLLFVSIFESPPNSRGEVSPPVGASCCTTLTGDVGAIRRSVDAFVAGQHPASAPSVPLDGVVAVTGESDFRWPTTLVFAICGLLVVSGGALILWPRSGAAGKAVGASLLTIGTLTGGGFTLVKEVKVDSVFKVDMQRLFDYVRNEVSTLAGTGPQQLGYIDKFKLGDGQQVELTKGSLTPVESVPVIATIARAWLDGRKEGKTAVLLVIGSTDRLPVSGPAGQQFDANFGLARARAENTKRALIATCKSMDPACGLSDDRIIVLVTGPRQTPARRDSSAAQSQNGFPEDRRVDVWALWTRNPAEVKR